MNETKDLLTKLMQACGLGEITSPVETVSGGLMHRMYKVTTDEGIYAVKHLNPEIMKRPDVFENYARAEKIEAILEQNDIPMVPALVFDGKKMQNVEANYFYVFRWQNGKITDWNQISKEQCYKAGNILGKIHAIEPKNVEAETPEVSRIDWQGHIKKAKEQNSVIAALLEEKQELFVYAESELNKARAALPAMRCLSNEDMDPKNIMWENGSPWVIDLECLDYGNPMSHAMVLALQWAGTVTEFLDTDKLMAFFDGYLKAYDNGFRGYDKLIGVAYNWVDWLEYNIRRTLGNCVDEAEQNLGIAEVRNTIHRIEYLREVETQIKEALQTRLAKPDATRFDTHDDRICYYELLLEKELADMLEYPLPEGYQFVPYADGDRDTWIAIEQSAKEFTTYEQGLEAWNRYYASSLDILPDRMFFIETDKGEKIATATAFYNIYGRDKSGAGWLHWVAVKREYQGNGLSKPLITYVLKIMKNLGYTHAKIPTQTNTWLACKVYLDLGFLPIKKNLEHSYEGWKLVKELTGHPAFDMVKLYSPKLEDLWFRQMFMADEETMSYNHHWGGIIPFPEENWAEWYDYWIANPEGKRFYRYLQEEFSGEFVGEIAYHFDEEENKYIADVIVYAKYRGKGYGEQGLLLLCEAAKESGVTVLHDNIAIDNPCIKLFWKVGFYEEYRTDEIIMLKKEL